MPQSVVADLLAVVASSGMFELAGNIPNFVRAGAIRLRYVPTGTIYEINMDPVP